MIRALLLGFMALMVLDLAARCGREPRLAIEDTLPPLARADYPLCVTVKPAPLLRTPQGRMDRASANPPTFME